VNRAMHDLLDTTLDGWYSYLASWEAPGPAGRLACGLCADSPFSRIDGIGDWPHDIIHRLVLDLTGAARHVHLTLEELDQASTASPPLFHSVPSQETLARSAVLARHAEALVLVGVRARREAMRDVLDNCIEPVLEEYLRSECERGLLELFAADDRDRPVY
jgi:hypothetical protein